MIVVLAEKLRQARELASGLLSGRKDYLDRMEGTGPDGEQVVVVWAQGHLYELAQPPAYDPELKKWSMATLPIMPSHFKVIPNQREEVRIASIQSWLRRADSIVHACDPDREGQLIGDEIMDNADGLVGKPVQRIWANSMEREDVLAQWARRRENGDYRSWGIAAARRREMDWLLGMNGTRALTLKAREAGHDRDQVYVVGRVQTPTLRLVVERDRARENFVKKAFFVVAGVFTHKSYPEQSIIAMWKPPEGFTGLDDDDQVIDKHVADKVAASVSGLPGRVRYVSRRDEGSRPPLPHNMASLQAAVNKKWGLTAKQTSDAAQSLYEDGMITYPGTKSRKLPDTLLPKIPEMVEAIGRTMESTLGPLAKDADVSLAGDIFVPEAQLGGSHHAIVPTRKVRSKNDAGWATEQKKVYDVVARTFLAHFFPDKVMEKVTIVFDVAGNLFDATKSFLKSVGWQVVLPPATEQQIQPMPSMWQNIKMEESVKCEKAATKERETSPPPPFNDGTLIDAMVGVYKNVADSAQKEMLQKTEGLGTDRTRSDALEALLEKNLLYRDGNKIHASQAGRDLIDSVVDEVSSPVLTARAEARLEAIIQGTEDDSAFVAEYEQQVRHLVGSARFVACTTPKPPPDGGPLDSKRGGAKGGGAENVRRGPRRNAPRSGGGKAA